ncbi:MAG TPA: T9SS type A sorting domain-containing protein, partial [Puia sp.]|nr:T9SS type A sorting domain-containing protein [Puia sp.]
INLSVTLQTEIAAFSGNATDQGNLLNWTAANEVNGAYFIIERSSGGSDFEAIGRVDGNNSGSSGNHSFTDTKPFPDVPSLYRLKLMDLGGGVYYSNIISVSVLAGRSIVEVLPNPFRDAINVRVNLAQAGKISLRMLDNKGMTVKQMDYEAGKGTNLLEIGDLSSLPISVYFIQIVLPDQVFVKKVFNNK